MAVPEAITLTDAVSPPEPFAFAPPDFRRLGYEVWLPEGDQTGCIRTYPRPDLSVRFLPHYSAGCEREIEDMAFMIETGMGPCLAELGYSAEYSKDTRSGLATFPSSEYLAWRLTEPTIEKGLGLPIFIVRRGDENFGIIEGTRALARGCALLSSSTRKFTQWPTDSVTEKYTIMGHDVISHAPAWLGLPPQIFTEFCFAAQEAIQIYDAAGDGKDVIDSKQRIREIMSYVDSTISTPTLQFLVQNKQTPGCSIGRNIRTIIGHNARLQPAEYELLIHNYLNDPVALRAVLEHSEDTPRIAIARLALHTA